MKHGSLFQKLHVNSQLLMLGDNGQTTVGHLSAVVQQQAAQRVVLRIILIDYFLIIHRYSNHLNELSLPRLIFLANLLDAQQQILVVGTIQSVSLLAFQVVFHLVEMLLEEKNGI